MVFDLHNDFPTAVPPAKRSDVLKRYAADGAVGICFVDWTTERKPTTSDLSAGNLPPLPFVALRAIEDLGSVQTDGYVDLFRAYRPAYASLTWNGENPLGGGVGCEQPLTARGREAVRLLGEAEIPLDLAHLSDTALDEALYVCTGRLLVSHTASRRCHGHPRNVTDDTAKRVAARGGLIGLAAIPAFLDGSVGGAGTCTRGTYLRHMTHLCDTVGTEHIAVGTDFNGGSCYPIGLTTYADFAALRYEMENVGFSAREIDAVFFENAKRFFAVKENQ